MPSPLISADELGRRLDGQEPPALLDIARGLAPFVIYEPEKALAHIEYIGEPSFGAPKTTEAP